MRVIFPIEKQANNNLIIYPDDLTFFSNTEIIGNNIIADYSGEKVFDIYTPPGDRHITLTHFYNRFTPEEHGVILESPNGVVRAWIDRLKAAAQDKGYVDMDHPDMERGKTKIVTLNLLTQERADEIFI